jgi:hypothetical protein
MLLEIAPYLKIDQKKYRELNQIFVKPIKYFEQFQLMVFGPKNTLEIHKLRDLFFIFTHNRNFHYVSYYCFFSLMIWHALPLD